MTKQLDYLIKTYIQKETNDTNTIEWIHIDNYNEGVFAVNYKQQEARIEVIENGRTYDRSILIDKKILLNIDDLNGDF